MLWRVYSNLRVRCARQSCDWVGDMFNYEQHLRDCEHVAGNAVPAYPPALAKPSQPQHPVETIMASSSQKATTESDFIGGTHSIVRDHQASDESQLSLRSGDKVTVQQVAAHGWVYGTRAGPADEQEKGWFPAFCLPEDRPPPPVQTPPPMSPPAGSTRVARDYDASDPAQLTVKEGDLVHVRQREATGWTFVVRVGSQGSGQREGWVPEWLLQPKDDALPQKP